MLATPRNKMLLAGRPDYFLTRNEESQLLHIGDDSTGSTIARIDLLPFVDEQIVQGLRNYYPGDSSNQFLSKLSAQSSLWELARRPIMMHIILESLDRIDTEGGEATDFTPAQLLRRYTNFWVNRESDFGVKKSRTSG